MAASTSRITSRRPDTSWRCLSAEVGFAMAVFAVWLLCLLAPMHQISRAITEFRLVGLDVNSSWNLCSPTPTKEDGQPPQTICPAHGLGGLLAPPDQAGQTPFNRTTSLPGPLRDYQWTPGHPMKVTDQPRGPPARVFG